AFLMGVGAILAMGCTIGQGMSGISTLSVNSMLAAASIAVGAWLGIRYLIEGEVPSIRRTISGLWNR
ncbi:MAG TPA: YeeE/YedE family protein, partial [Rhizobiales bacterium]|nr:YeeE/YedE family protein [Hyphomicrobiales bacterium]